MMTNKGLTIESMIAKGRFLLSRAGRFRYAEFAVFDQMTTDYNCDICGGPLKQHDWAMLVQHRSMSARSQDDTDPAYIHLNSEMEACESYQLARQLQAAVEDEKPKRRKR